MSLGRIWRRWGRRLQWPVIVASPLTLPVSAGWFGDSLADMVRAATEWPADGTWYAPAAWLSWAGSAALYPLSHEAQVRAAGAAVGFAVFAVTALTLYLNRNRLLSSEASRRDPGIAARRTVLILGLSTCEVGREKPLSDLPMRDTAVDKAAMRARIAEAKGAGNDDIAAQLETMEKANISWQQSFRMVWAHLAAPGRRTPLRAILLVTSSGTRGSQERADAFVALLEERMRDAVAQKHLSGPLPQVLNVTPEGIDFEDYTGVVETLNDAVALAEWEFGTPHDRICVDVTPGQKTYSIAAAMVTMNRKLIFGYVTNQGVASFYDARIAIGAALGEG